MITLHQVSEKSDGTVWFTNLYIKKAYSQLYWDDFTSKQCKFSIVGGKITGTNQFWFHGLGDEFPELSAKWIPKSNRLVHGKCSFYYLYLNETLISFKGTLKEHKEIVQKIFIALDTNVFAIKWPKWNFS